MFYHYGQFFAHPNWVHAIGSFGWTGVDLFFVLSGYLITSQLLREAAVHRRLSLKRFYIRRSLRILPAYAAILSLYFLFPALRESDKIAPLWKFIIFTQNIGLDATTLSAFSHAWSLCIEEHFYLVLPIFIMGLLHTGWLYRGVWLIPLLSLLGLLLRYYLYETKVLGSADTIGSWYTWIYFPTWARLDGLLAGVGLAALLHFRSTFRQGINAYGKYLLLGGVVLLFTATRIYQDPYSWLATLTGFPVIAAGYGLLVAAAVSPSVFLYRYASPITTFIAGLAYSLYLTHMMAFHLAQQQLSKWDWHLSSTGVFALCLSFAFVCAIVLNQLVERPFIRWRDKLLKSQTG